MENTNLLGPSFELNSNFSRSTSAARGHFAVSNGGQRVFTRYTSDPGLTQSSSSSPPSSPCSLTAIDSSPPSSPALAPVAEDDIDLDTDMDLEDATFKLNLDRAKVRCITPELEGHARNREEIIGTRKSGGNMVVLQTSPAHPFSASTRGVKRPPMYDKSASRAKIRRKNLSFESAGSDETSPGSSQDSGANAYQRPLPMPVFGLGHPLGYDPFAALDGPNNVYMRDAYLHDDGHVDDGMDLEFGSARRSFNPELTLWEETIAQAVDGAESKIDLRCASLLIGSCSYPYIASYMRYIADTIYPSFLQVYRTCRALLSSRDRTERLPPKAMKRARRSEVCLGQQPLRSSVAAKLVLKRMKSTYFLGTTGLASFLMSSSILML